MKTLLKEDEAKEVCQDSSVWIDVVANTGNGKTTNETTGKGWIMCYLYK